MSYQCELKEQAAQPTLMVRATTPVQELPRVFVQGSGHAVNGDADQWVLTIMLPPSSKIKTTNGSIAIRRSMLSAEANLPSWRRFYFC